MSCPIVRARGTEWPLRALLPLTIAAALAACWSPPQGHSYSGPLYSPPELPACSPSASADTVVVCPGASTAILANPHSGVETFYAMPSERPDDRWQKGTVVYQRFWWDELEPAPGEIRFDALDRLFERARAEGQTVALRVMPEETAPFARRVPAWLEEEASGTWGTRDGVVYFSPDYDAPAFLDAVRRTARLLGERYGDDPALESVDVGFVGASGEWAFTVDQAHLPSTASGRRIIDAVVDAFGQVPVVQNIGAIEDDGRFLKYALSQGAGWRVDCWGDIGEGWNHHDDAYEQQLDAAGAGDAWRTAPVLLETCGDMQTWELSGYKPDQVRWILHWALEKHASRVNLKSRSVPAGYRAAVEEFLLALGYRLVLHEVRLARAQGRVEVATLVANRGVAPFYRPLRLAVRARVDDRVLASATLPDALDLLTETQTVAGALDVPAGSAFWVDVALAAPSGDVAARLANTGVRGDGWLPVAEVSF